MERDRLFQIPELSLCPLAFFLNFFWEVVHTYLYTVKDSPLDALLNAWFHCTWGDVMITLGSFWFVCLMSWNRRWFLNLNGINFTGFLMIGLVYTVFSEWANVRIFRSWNYNELMPIIPWIRVGLTPVLQWILVPSITILLLRHYFSLIKEVVKEG